MSVNEVICSNNWYNLKFHNHKNLKYFASFCFIFELLIIWTHFHYIRLKFQPIRIGAYYQRIIFEYFNTNLVAEFLRRYRRTLLLLLQHRVNELLADLARCQTGICAELSIFYNFYRTEKIAEWPAGTRRAHQTTASRADWKKINCWCWVKGYLVNFSSELVNLY